MQKWLFKSVDNSQLVIFRMLFGFLIACECWGAIFTGWIRRGLIEPKFTFNFIGLDFLQPLPGNGMYFYFGIMGALGICIMLGYRYILSCVSFTILWGSVYLMQKSSYNNHYYLLWILTMIMSVLPAHKDLSLDAKLQYTSRSNTMPNWVWFLIVGQLFIVYTYASVAKLYPDWLNHTVAANLMASKASYPIVGEVLQKDWAHKIITYTGILFDLLIIPALLFKRTRKVAFGIAVFFHLYNSIVLQIGIFPYLALAFCLFFFPTAKVRLWFYPKKQKNSTIQNVNYPVSKVVVVLVSIWLLIQVALPLRHWFIKGDVLWTEEGHRLSWRMMLRSIRATNTFYVVKKGSFTTEKVVLKDFLTVKQINSMGGKPDMIWQFAQRLKKTYKEKGIDISVYVKNRTRVNGSESHQLIDPKVDLANVKWNYFSHNNWIISPEEKE